MSRRIHVVKTEPAMPEGWREHGIQHGAIVRCPIAGNIQMMVVEFGPGGLVVCAWVNRVEQVKEYAFPWAALKVLRPPK